MQYTFMLAGEVPSKKNGRIATSSGRNYPSNEYQAWHDTAAVQLMAQERPLKPIEKCEAVSMTFYHSDLRRRDTNNQVASVFDLLVDCKILADDCWTVTGKESAQGVFDAAGKARCEVGIEAGS